MSSTKRCKLFRDLKITDWTALSAFVLSLWFGLLGPLIANNVGPRIDISPPEDFQFTCIPTPKNANIDGVYQCADGAVPTLTADLFSFWNTAFFSTREEVILGVRGELTVPDGTKLPFRWDYFTEATDALDQQKRNAGRFTFGKGQLVNHEMQFFFQSDMTWQEFLGEITGKDATKIVFLVTTKHNATITFECSLGNIDPDRASKHFYFTLRHIECNGQE